MRNVNRIKQLLIGTSGLCGGALLYYYFRPNREAHASWTTNYVPSAHAKWDSNWDHRCPKSMIKRTRKDAGDDNLINEEIEKNKPTAVRNIILIRHGQYNTSGRNDQERILTELGRKQAAWTAERLKQLKVPFTELVKSTMTRAQETGAIIQTSLSSVPVENCSLIEEGAPVPPEPPIGHWKPEYYQFYQDGARIEAAFRRYFHRAEASQDKDSYTILVCHANVIRYFVCRALQFPPEGWLRISLNHASITWLSITPNGRVILRTLGDSGHMPPDGVTYR